MLGRCGHEAGPSDSPIADQAGAHEALYLAMQSALWNAKPFGELAEGVFVARM